MTLLEGIAYSVLVSSIVLVAIVCGHLIRWAWRRVFKKKFLDMMMGA